MMRLIKKKSFTALALIILLASPFVAQAAEFNFENPLDPHSTNVDAEATIQAIISNIIGFILGIAAVVALLVIVYGGLRLIIGAAGNEQEVAKAKRIILIAVIGLLIIGMSTAILRLIRFSLGLGVQ